MDDFGQARVRRMPPLFCLLAAGYALAADAGPSASLKQAIQSMQRRDWKQAEQAIDEALEKSPEETAAVYWKSYVLFQTGRYQESATYAVRYLEKEPNSTDGHKILGLDYFMQGQPAPAEVELKLATGLSPTDSEVRYYLGRIQFERQNLPAALESFQSVVSLDPASVRGFNHLGQTYEGLAQFSDARLAYKKAIELEQTQAKKSEWPYFNLGVLSLKEGQSIEAIRWLREALVRRGSWTEAKVQLAAALSAGNQLDEARRLLEEALAAEPKNAGAHYQLARLLVKMRRPDEARRHFLLFAELQRR
jgi:tetratricopeptide (TPR) repeat protein